jgi:hypothetical protein
VDVAAPGDDLAHALRGQLAVPVRREQQFRAVGEEFRRTALIGGDMGRVGADNALIGLAQRRQSQRIGCRAVEDEKDFAVGLEHRAQAVAHRQCVVVIAIGGLEAPVGGVERGQGFRTDAGRVVAGKLQLETVIARHVAKPMGKVITKYWPAVRRPGNGRSRRAR